MQHSTLLLLTNHTITATFSANTYTLTVNIVGSGTVTKSPPGPTYPAGTVVTLTATPAAGYTFTGWSGDLSGTQNPAAITMDSNKTIISTFSPSTYSISGTVYDPMNGGVLGGVRVTITSPGMQPVWDYTDSEGRYEITDLPDGRQYTVTPNYFNGQFFPASSTVEINDYPVNDVNFWWWSE